jgi:catechol 2,3-dioxygenase-like lactoylglutathione lyase family enzyme
VPPVRIHHIALRVADCERAAAFYSSVLGLTDLRRAEVEDGRARSIWLSAGETILMLELSLRGSGREDGSGHVLAFEVDDLAECERRLRDLGIAVTDRTAHTLYIEDPDGHRVGLTVFGLEKTRA